MKTQIWIAVSVYVLIAIIRKRLGITTPLYTMLQILSVTLLEKLPLYEALTCTDPFLASLVDQNQLNLFES